MPMETAEGNFVLNGVDMTDVAPGAHIRQTDYVLVDPVSGIAEVVGNPLGGAGSLDEFYNPSSGLTAVLKGADLSGQGAINDSFDPNLHAQPYVTEAGILGVGEAVQYRGADLGGQGAIPLTERLHSHDPLKPVADTPFGKDYDPQIHEGAIISEGRILGF